MRISLLTTIAAAALIAGAGLAAAQTNIPGSTKTAQHSSQRRATERQSSMVAQAEDQSGATEQKEQPSDESGAMEKTPSQGRSSVEQKEQPYGEPGAMEKEHRSGQPGAMENAPSQGRSAAEQKEHPYGGPGAMEKEHGTRQPGAMEKGPTQGRSAAEERGYRSHERGAMQGPAEGRSAQQNRGRITEQRSVAPVNLSSSQKTEIHRVITGPNIHRVGHVNFSLAVGTAIPRTVQVYPVPERIVRIIPEYRGFDYIVVRNELVIIDPATLQIVAILPA
jgi:Protein of unknown function (DUF1236)